jgi:hypothetical protein
VCPCCQAWFEEGREARVPGSDRRRSTTAAQDRYLTIMPLRDRHNSTRRVGDERFGVNGQPIHMRSISFQFVASFGLQSYRLHLVLPLTAEHKRQRLDWCRTREHWDIESNIIVFSEESRFCLGHHDVRQRVKDDVLNGAILRSFLWCAT